MATVKPFAAIRPDPGLAARICELPYDVLSSDEARSAAAGNPLSFFHVSKAEIDLDPDIDPHDPKVYAQAARAFASLLQRSALRADAQPGFYLYRQVMGAHRQTGLVAVTSCEEYLSNRIRRHELTRPDKEDDRVRHIESLNAQTGPAFLIYPEDRELAGLFGRICAAGPDVDFVAADGVRHSAWPVHDPESLRFIEERFQAMPALYIADGHHRSAAAARVFRRRSGAGRSGWFLSVLFPADQVQILPYHRVVRDLNGLTPDQFLARLSTICLPAGSGSPAPARSHQFGLLLGQEWRTFEFRPEVTSVSDPLQKLDVALLQQHVLAPILGIDNPRTSERIQFVGGIRGTPELERLVKSGEHACAFAMYPTGVQQLITVAEAGGLMPPKSTWFEPKLRDGMFSHQLD